MRPTHRHDAFWTRVFLFGASCVAGLLIARKRKLRRLHMHILTSKSYDFGRYFGMDIGGTLTKMVYFQPAERELSRPERDTQHSEGSLRRIESFLLSLNSSDRQQSAQREERLELFNQQLGGTIHFCNFQSSKMDEMTDFVRHRFFHRYIKKIACTGGGAFKFCRMFEEKLGIEIYKADEMDALIKGLNFVLQHAQDECYTFTDVVPVTQGLAPATKKIMPTPSSDELYPFLLVNIGSGVSILKISGPNSYDRVSGTSLGGGTFWGLCKSLSKLQSYDAAMDASVVGDSNAVDMTVGDIYGQDGYAQFQLTAATVASSMGKMATRAHANDTHADEDMARSLLFMITQNIGHVAYLNARRVATNRIYFCGNFLRHNEIASRQLAYAIDFWSKSEVQAQFFHHEGFFGALGALLGQLQPRIRTTSSTAAAAATSTAASTATTADAKEN